MWSSWSSALMSAARVGRARVVHARAASVRRRSAPAPADHRTLSRNLRRAHAFWILIRNCWSWPADDHRHLAVTIAGHPCAYAHGPCAVPGGMWSKLGVRACRLDVPADCHGAVALSDPARGAPAQYPRRTRPAVSHVRAAARRLAAERILPAAAGRSGGGSDAWTVQAACVPSARSSCRSRGLVSQRQASSCSSTAGTSFCSRCRSRSAPSATQSPSRSRSSRGQYQVPWGQVLAAAVVATSVVAGVVLVAQRRIVAGLTSGAVKG